MAHLLTMTRGAETGGDRPRRGGGLRGSWAARFAADRASTSPGTRFRYDNGASQLLAEVLHRVTGDLAAYAGARLLGPLESPRGPGCATRPGPRPARGT